MKNEFVLAFNEVLEEKQLPRDVIIKALESAMVSAYRKSVNASNAQHVDAKIELETGKVKIFAEKEVVETVQDLRTEVSLAEARRYDPTAELGSMVVVDTTPNTPADFGRVAAQTARQVIQQRIREAERQAQLSHFEKQVGEVISGVIQAVNSQAVTIGLDMKAEGVMPRKEMIPGERFKVPDRVRALVFEVKDGPRGPQIYLSRAHKNFLRRLLETEVPEIYHGVVEIRSIAREPGERAKVAVAATQQGIDPVGACVGIRGVRIQAIVHELHDEKIDVIEWNPDSAQYIAKAISPARVSGVYLNEKSSGGKTATVVVPEDQLSLAIGRDGQNARLAAKLTGWRIDIKSLPEAANDAFHKLKLDPDLATVIKLDADYINQVEAILAKKAEGRVLQPEEYDMVTRFVDRVERRSAARLVQAAKPVEEAVSKKAAEGINDETFKISILDSGLPDHVCNTLQEAGYLTLGDLLVQYRRDPDSVLKLHGIGPKSMAEIQKLMASALVAKPVEEQKAPEETSAVVVAPPVAPVEQVPPEVITSAQMVTPAAEPVPQVEPVVEKVETPVVETPQPEATPTATVTVIEEEDEEKQPSLAEIFAVQPEVLLVTPTDEEEDDDGSKKDRKKKKKKHAEIEFDPDRNVTISHKKHKRGSGWEDW